jgi:hypothetical protein
VKKKLIGLMFTIVLSLTCIISVYGSEDDEIATVSADSISLDGGISTCSSNVIGSMTASVNINTNHYSGSAAMLTKGTGTLTLYLWKMNSDGTHTTVDSASKYFASKSVVALSDYYNLTYNSGTYKCRAECKANTGYYLETMTCTSAAVTR